MVLCTFQFCVASLVVAPAVKKSQNVLYITPFYALSSSYLKNKSRASISVKIFRQPGCLWEIQEAFRPTLADG